MTTTSNGSGILVHVTEHRGLLPRKAELLVAEALEDTRVVLVNGARQAGKSTLTRLTAGATPGAVTRLLDDPATLQSVLDDPTEFVDHYRTKDDVEVDAVLETPDGRVIGVEVKAGATIRSEDMAGLRHLANRLGDRFVAGYVLYAGQQSLPFGDKLRAVPVDALWRLTPTGS